MFSSPRSVGRESGAGVAHTSTRTRLFQVLQPRAPSSGKLAKFVRFFFVIYRAELGDELPDLQGSILQGGLREDGGCVHGHVHGGGRDVDVVLVDADVVGVEEVGAGTDVLVLGQVGDDLLLLSVLLLVVVSVTVCISIGLAPLPPTVVTTWRRQLQSKNTRLCRKDRQKTEQTPPR